MNIRDLVLSCLALLALLLLASWPGEAAAHVAQLATGAASAPAQDDDAGDEDDDDGAFTLEELFDDDRPSPGPTARSMAFSHDGRYGAYLFTPYIERRHGTDIWLYDTATGDVTRLTSATVMSTFQESAREVTEDRIAKAKRRERGGENRRDGEGGEGGDVTGDAGDIAAVRAAVAGVWEGRMTTDQDLGLPPDGLAFTLNLHVEDDGAIAGSFQTDVMTTNISSGEYDAESGRLSCTLSDAASGMAADLIAQIDGDEMSATIEVEALNATFNLTATRTADAGAPPSPRASRGGRAPGAPSPAAAMRLFDASGVWEGRLTSDQDIGLPPDGLPFTLTIRVADDGSVSGTFETDLVSTQITSGSYDEDSGELRCTLTDPSSEMVGELVAEIDGDKMTATIEVAALNATLNLDATRTGDAGDMQEQRDEDDDDEDEEELDDEQRDELGDTVGEDDADDRRAPRYSGVGSFAWSPVAHEMIFSSEGDLYRMTIDSGEIQRLTRTQESEQGVDYLPDGSGYSYMSGGSLIRVKFGSHLREQMDPQLSEGFSLSSYQISPDGNRVIILASKGGNMFSGGTTVSIISYRGRLAQVREVSRHMPPDEFPEIESRIYYFDMGDFLHEESELAEVFTHKHTGPRDIMRVPEWAPDSRRVAFSVFDQNTGHVGIYEAVFPDEGEDDAPEVVDSGDDDASESTGRGGRGRGRGGFGGGGAARMDVVKRPTKMVYRFFHNGGPNTPEMIVPFYLADSRKLAFLTELSGFRHLHVLDPLYESLQQVTSGQWELYPIEVSRDHKLMFATGTKGDPAQEHVFVIDLESGELIQKSSVEGVYGGVAVSPDGSHVLATHSDFGKLTDLVAIKPDGEMTKLTDNHPEEAYKYIKPTPQYFTFKNRHGHTIHGHMFTPPGWEPSDDDRRPLMVYVYGGPLGERKMITRGSYSAPSYTFAHYMAAQHGYVTCTIDPRGMSGYGGLFEKSSFESVGRAQTEDLVDGIRWMIDNHHVDADKVGMHGWSFGGFQTQTVMYTEPDVLACGIAGAGPTEWVNYNSWYTTGTIGTRENIVDDPDKETYSLVPLAKNLKGELLLVHGMEDSNVLYQDTVKVYQALLQAGKETLVELFLDPTGGHGLGGDVDTLKRYRKFEEFFVRHLGSHGEANDDEGDEDEDSDGDDD